MARSGTQVSKMTNPMMMRARSLSTNDVAALQTVATQERQEHGVSVEDVEMLKDMFNDVITKINFMLFLHQIYTVYVILHARCPLISFLLLVPFLYLCSGTTTP